MKLYLAGNFPQMDHVAREFSMMKWCLGRSVDYNRLLTYYYLSPSTVNVIAAARQVKEEQ